MIGGTRFRIDADIARQSTLSARIARGQIDISSGKRLQRASDDPAAAARIAVLRRQAIDGAAWQATVESGAAIAARADNTLASVSTLLDRARELVTSAASATLNTGDRAVIANELRSLADQFDGLARETDASGQRLFPDISALKIPIGQGVVIAATLSRAEAFTVTASGGPTEIGAILRSAAASPGTAVADIVAASEHVSAARGDQGARAARIEAARDQLLESVTLTAEERSMLENTDVAATVARIQADQLSLDAAQALFAKINRRTLFDLLG